MKSCPVCYRSWNTIIENGNCRNPWLDYTCDHCKIKLRVFPNTGTLFIIKSLIMSGDSIREAIRNYKPNRQLLLFEIHGEDVF